MANLIAGLMILGTGLGFVAGWMFGAFGQMRHCRRSHG
jgi:hypothetical protein